MSIIGARIRTPAEPEEVARARSYLALSYPEEFETPGQIALQAGLQIVDSL